MTHEQKNDVAERNGFYDIAFIQLTSTKNPFKQWRRIYES